MPLDKQLMPLSFGVGVDTKTDPKQLIPAKMITLENASTQSPGQYMKRNGFTELNPTALGGGSYNSGQGLSVYRDELVSVMGPGAVFTSRDTSNSAWGSKGVCDSMEMTTRLISSYWNGVNDPDMAFDGTSHLYCFTGQDQGGNGLYSIMDGATGQIVVNNATIANSSWSIKPFVLGGQFIILFWNTANNHLQYRLINPTTPLSIGAAVDVATTMNAGYAMFDACIMGTTLYIAFNNNDGGTGGISLVSISNAYVVSAVTDVAGDAGIRLHVFPDLILSQIWIAYWTTNGNHQRVMVRNSALGAVLAPTTVDNHVTGLCIIGYANNGTAQLFYSTNNVADIRYMLTFSAQVTNAGVVTGAGTVFLRGVAIVSKPFVLGAFHYFLISYQNSTLNTAGSVYQGTIFLVRSDGFIVAKVNPGTATSGFTGNTYTGPQTWISQVYSPNGGIFQIPFSSLQQPSISVSLIANTRATLLATFDFVAANGFGFLEAGEECFVTGGYLSSYDGQSCTEHDFHLYPDIASADFVATPTAATIPDGTYRWKLTYEWLDFQGQRHISDTSPFIEKVLAGGPNLVTITCSCLRLTSKGARTLSNSVQIGVYRTTDLSAGPSNYFLVGYATNDPTADTVAFVDADPNTDLTAHIPLYTTGGVVENYAPPATSIITTYKNRVLALSSENKNEFSFSQQVIPNSPVIFSPLFTWNIDTFGGDVGAWSQMDDKLVLFKERNIGWMVGDGPADTGAQNDFSSVQFIPTDTGCTNQRSVILIPPGILYQSLNGWYLLDRSLSVKYIGADVEAYNPRTVTSTVLIPKSTQVKITLTGGTVIVWDYMINQWYIDTPIPAAASTIFNDEFTFIKNEGYVDTESTGYLDYVNTVTQFIQMKLVTSWIKLAGLTGYQRAYDMLILGQYKSPHTLNVQVAYDYDPTVVQTSQFVISTSVTPYEFRVFFQKQKCEAIQITIFDSAQSGTGESMALSGIQLKLGMKKGLYKLPASKAAG